MGKFMVCANYTSENEKRERLYDLFERAFHIPVHTLQDFYKKGFWDLTYSPLTLFEEEVAIANVSMFLMPMMVGGERIKAAGIQSVMTHPNYRNKGFMKQLFGEMLKKIDEEYNYSFLFTEAPELYTPFGFKVAKEYISTIQYEKSEQKLSSIRKLDFFDEKDVQLMKDVFENKECLSRSFAPLHYQSSFYLNMYNEKWNKKLYFSEELDAILVYEIEEGILKLYGVISELMPILDELCAVIPETFHTIEFYFSPDQLGIENADLKLYESKKCLMVRGELPVEFNECKFPILAEF
ncbi:GNAT family N-acetyltransferase [Bacillus cytotoxicus]|uniref:GNAT family N-acetyltransferase n=1 Tax=Bacillus cytotoxicus TaxID=580165 RepID=A0ACC6AAV9_9BACI|nr:GNAT family N-acetyltransferase [Bacillus cytotoxicus]